MKYICIARWVFVSECEAQGGGFGGCFVVYGIFNGHQILAACSELSGMITRQTLKNTEHGRVDVYSILAYC